MNDLGTITNKISEMLVREISPNLLEAQQNSPQTIVKGTDDYLTISDFLTQVQVMRHMQHIDPGIRVIGEENPKSVEHLAKYDDTVKRGVDDFHRISDSYTQQGASEKILCVDPIDGTRIFKGKGSAWTCALAYQEEGADKAAFILHPKTNQLYVRADNQQSYVVEWNAQLSTPSRRVLHSNNSSYVGEWIIPFLDMRKYKGREVVPGLTMEDMRDRLSQKFVGMDLTRPDSINFVKQGSGTSSFTFAQIADGHSNMHGYIAFFQAVHDMAPGAYILEGAGGAIVGAACASDGTPVDTTFRPWKELRARVDDTSKKYHVIASGSEDGLKILMDIVSANYKLRSPSM